MVCYHYFNFNRVADMKKIIVLDSLLIMFSVLFMTAVVFIGNGILWYVYFILFSWLLR